jgi:hypothetical protein
MMQNSDSLHNVYRNFDDLLIVPTNSIKIPLFEFELLCTVLNVFNVSLTVHVQN